MNEIVLDDSVNYVLNWEIENNDTILFILSANIKTWLSIGWSNSYGMNDADYIVGTFNNDGTLNITDRVLPNGAKYQSPYIDTKVGGTNDILTSYGFQTADYTYIQFTRKLITNDTIGDRDLTVDREQNFIWARGVQSLSNLKYHHENRGSLILKLNILNGNVNLGNGLNYIYWHIGLMVTAFLILMPLGIFVARYFKQYNYWFPIHYILLGTSLAFALTGFVIAFIMSQRKFSKDVVHAWFGLFTIIFMVFSVLLGITSHYMWDSNRKKTPIFPDIIHHFTARFTYLLALATLWTGLYSYGAPKAYSIILGFIVFIFIGLAIFLEIYKKLYPKESLLSQDTPTNSKTELNSETLGMEGANN